MDFWLLVRCDRGMPDPLILLAGAVAGAVFGLFGAGGAAFATPMLALAGVPGAIAVATPLPALLPASVLSARRQVRAGNLDTRLAGLVVAGGVPGAVLGALASGWLSGHALLVARGVLLLIVGARVLFPDAADHAVRAAAWRERAAFVVVPAFAIGVLSGLLANSGGVFLVPMFILLLGLTAARAAGTSIVAAGALTIPTLAVHMSLGHVDWTIALVFGLGLLPGSLAGSLVERAHPGPGRPPALRRGPGGLRRLVPHPALDRSCWQAVAAGSRKPHARGAEAMGARVASLGGHPRCPDVPAHRPLRPERRR